MADNVLPVEAIVYADGELVTVPLIHPVNVTPRQWNRLFLPDVKNTSWGYKLDLEPIEEDAAGWITFRLTLAGVDGSLLGTAGVPVLLWRRPWAVPMAYPVPQRYPGDPRYVVRLRVTDPAAAAFQPERQERVFPFGELPTFLGPTDEDPDPGAEWHDGCGGRVMRFKEGAICEKCKAQEEPAPGREADTDD